MKHFEASTKTTFSYYRLDRWLYAAIECLEYFPDQFLVMVSQQLPQSTNNPSNLNTYKKIFFDVIIKYYSQKKDSLLATQDFDIHSGIIELIGKSNLEQKVWMKAVWRMSLSISWLNHGTICNAIADALFRLEGDAQDHY